MQITRRILTERRRGQTFQAIAERLMADAIPTARGNKCRYPATIKAVVTSDNAAALAVSGRPAPPDPISVRLQPMGRTLDVGEQKRHHPRPATPPDQRTPTRNATPNTLPPRTSSDTAASTHAPRINEPVRRHSAIFLSMRTRWTRQKTGRHSVGTVRWLRSSLKLLWTDCGLARPRASRLHPWLLVFRKSERC